MSHVSTYDQKITDTNRFIRFAKKKGYGVRENVTVNMFSRNHVLNATAIKIPGWKYEVALTKDGNLLYDFFGSQPGTFELLGELIQECDYEQVMEEIPHSEISMISTDRDKEGNLVITLNY